MEKKTQNFNQKQREEKELRILKDIGELLFSSGPKKPNPQWPWSDIT